MTLVAAQEVRGAHCMVYKHTDKIKIVIESNDRRTVATLKADLKRK